MDEPRHHPRFLVLLGLVALATIPWPFVGENPALLLGVPLWLWWSLGWTAVLSALTAFGLQRYWREDETSEGGASEGEGAGRASRSRRP